MQMQEKENYSVKKQSQIEETLDKYLMYNEEEALNHLALKEEFPFCLPLKKGKQICIKKFLGKKIAEKYNA